MKRALSLAAALLISFACFSEALAEIDLTGLTFEELLALNKEVVTEMTRREEWRSVVVPAGVYEIGVDIPSGYWTITPEVGDTAIVRYGSRLNETKSNIPSRSIYDLEKITSPEDSYYEYHKVDHVSWDLSQGGFIVIEECSVLFEPFTRKTLGF